MWGQREKKARASLGKGPEESCAAHAGCAKALSLQATSLGRRMAAWVDMWRESSLHLENCHLIHPLIQRTHFQDCVLECPREYWDNQADLEQQNVGNKVGRLVLLANPGTASVSRQAGLYSGRWVWCLGAKARQ